MSQHRPLLTPEEYFDLCNALDVLCGCYGNDPADEFVSALLKRYAPGTPDGDRARTLFQRLLAISNLSTADFRQHPSTPC